MKAKLRRLQKEKEKEQEKLKQNESQSQIQNQSNGQHTINESQNQNQDEISQQQNNNQIISNINNNNEENINSNINLLKKNLKQEKNKPMSAEEYKQQELSKIATMFNFEVDKKNQIINIKENDEYYDMRKQINDLETELENTKMQYDNLIQNNKSQTEMQKEQIEELENELKKLVDYDIENLKKENIMLLRDVNLLDKKLDSVKTVYQKEQYDMKNTINELDSTIKKLKDEIYYVEDLKLRLNFLLLFKKL